MADRRSGGDYGLWEIQVHGPRGNVRYMRVTKLRLQLVVSLTVVFLAYFVNAVAAAPTLVRLELFRADQVELVEARLRFGQRFEALTGRYEEMRAVASDLDDRLCKVVLAYGVEGTAADGCGLPVDLGIGPGATISEEQSREVREAIEEDVERVVERLAGRLEAAVAVEAERPDLVRFTPSASPLRGDDFVLVAPFGETTNRVTSIPEFHYGIDLAAPAGAPVRATAAGRVTFAGRGSALGPAWRRYGRMLGIRHGDGFITVYGHLEETEVRAGQRIERGQRIGTVGMTGWSVEPNLHYGILRRRNDGSYEPVDPRIHILDYRWRDEQALVSGVVPAPDGFPTLPRTLLR
ncbi:MAG: M23 family metallopeptidase [Acidobacteria bacterium]|nr:M23 family metallopeptidase [Acidobacteriota bacterium]